MTVQTFECLYRCAAAGVVAGVVLDLPNSLSINNDKPITVETTAEPKLHRGNNRVLLTKSTDFLFPVSRLSSWYKDFVISSCFPYAFAEKICSSNAEVSANIKRKIPRYTKNPSDTEGTFRSPLKKNPGTANNAADENCVIV